MDGLSIGLAYEGMNDLADVLYFADLGAPEPDRVFAVYQTLLEANNMWAGTGGATLGLQQDTGWVVLAGRIDFESLSPESLVNLLGMFAQTASAWKSFVDGTHGVDDNAAPAFALRA